MANKKTLKPQAHVLTTEERSKGGKASAIHRKEKKAVKTILNELLTMPLQDNEFAELNQIKSISSIKGQNISVQEAVCLALVHKALKGDLKAFLSILDITGQKPDGYNDEDGYDDNLMQELDRAASAVWGEEL